MIRRFAFLLVVLTISAASALGQQISIADTATLNLAAGEAQSTVVPPNKKTQCKQGRFLVTHDGIRPPYGVVFGRNLDDPNGPVIGSTFDISKLAGFNAEPAKSKYFFGTNDHDLLTLSNGDVLYLTGAFSRVSFLNPLNAIVVPGGDGGGAMQKNPDWFDYAFRDGVCNKYAADGNCAEKIPFGPGARSVLLVWRSTDCGETFQYVSQVDPARVGDGSCAQPQFRRDAKGNIINAKPYDMGGSDGQLVKVDPANDRLYLTFQCVGFERDTSSPSPDKIPPLNTVDPNAPPPPLPPFKLSQTPLNKTLVVASYNQGNSWQNLGIINQAEWRFSVIPEGNDLGFGYASSLLFGKKTAAGNYSFDSTGIKAPNGNWNWWVEANLKDNPNIPTGSIYANVWAVPLLTRTPDSKSYLLAFPDIISASANITYQKGDFGYRVYFFDGASNELVESKAILPAKLNADDVAFHLVAIDPGEGPILLYWYDLDSAAKSITIRGRLITGKGETTNDFSISQKSGQPASFNLTSVDYWFGDYQTAGGFVSGAMPAAGQGPFKVTLQKSTHYNYYPMWIEPDGTVRYTSVVYTKKTNVLDTIENIATGQSLTRQIQVSAIPREQWKRQPPPVDLRAIQRPVREMKTTEPDVQQIRRVVLRPPLRVLPRPRSQ